MKKRVTVMWGGCLAAAGLLAFFQPAAAQQEVKRPPLLVPETADTVQGLVPPGWRAEKEPLKEVDLNGDGRLDAAFVISHGGFNANEAEAPVVKHVLILALRGDDGKLHRSIVSDAVVLDGDEGGAFGDPFSDLSIEQGAVVIMHYGGSRDRWGYTHRYRYQDGRWMLIHLSFGNTDSLDLEHYDNHEIMLTNGLVEASEKGDYEGRPKKPETGGSYYELEVLPIDKSPDIDGRVAAGEWPGYFVLLNEKGQVYRNRRLWGGVNDVSAKLHAVRGGEELFVCAEVADNIVTAGDVVRLVTKKGVVIRPRQSKISQAGNGYVLEARYSLKAIARALKTDNQYIVEEVQSVLDSSEGSGGLEGLGLPVSVEVIDVDNSRTRRVRSVLSTRLFGSPYSGAIRIFRPGTLVLVSDNEQ